MLRFRYFAAPVVLAAPLLLGLPGCASDELDEPLASESRAIGDDALDDVPAGTRVIKQGHEPLLFQAPSDGTVWVYNASDKRLVYTGAIAAGQSVHVDPDHDFVLMNGRKVVDMKMDDFDQHQILFAPSAVTAGSRTTPAQPAPAPAQPAPAQQPAVIVQPAPAPAPAQQPAVIVQPAQPAPAPAQQPAVIVQPPR